MSLFIDRYRLARHHNGESLFYLLRCSPPVFFSGGAIAARAAERRSGQETFLKWESSSCRNPRLALRTHKNLFFPLKRKKRESCRQQRRETRRPLPTMRTSRGEISREAQNQQHKGGTTFKANRLTAEPGRAGPSRAERNTGKVNSISHADGKNYARTGPVRSEGENGSQKK